MQTNLNDMHGKPDEFTRRECLRVGSLGASGLGFTQLISAKLASGQELPSATSGIGSGAAFGKAKSVILFWLNGGPAQHETWDPKPNAPLEVRGPFQPIATRTNGLQVCELMPRTAQLTDKIAVLRAVVTGDNAHSSSGYAMLTGVPHIPLNAESVTAKAPNLWPCADSIVRLFRASKNGLPASVVLPEHVWNDGNFPWPGQDAGFLGRKFDPWLIPCDPNSPQFKIPDLSFPDDVTASRFDHRRRLLEQVNGRIDETLSASPVRRYSDEARQANGLLGGSAARQAFDLSQEPDALRDRYGRSRYSQSVLLARRLVESGVSVVRINWTRIAGKPNQGGWDTHSAHSQSCKEFLMPMMDQAYSALLEDLNERGLLDQTLVVWLGEFGRTPKFNANAGRDHWGSVFSIALAGAGVRGGIVHGSSDRHAAFPVEGRVEPHDVLATIYHSLGLRPETEIHDALGSPQPISRGSIIHSIF